MALSSPLAFARRLKARARASGEPRAVLASDRDVVRFECNLCGTQNVVLPGALSREVPSCAQCRSTVLLRAVAHLVVSEVLGVTQPLAALSPRPDIAGIGVSDDERYAGPLARVFKYENTHFHTEPRLDITAVPPARAGRYDFVVASDVFEHVVPPVARAFRGARALLRRGGVLVFTVPFTLGPDTIEHFPELHAWRLVDSPHGWRLHNVTANGRVQVFDDLVFHGGPGSTLEMRVFSQAALERAFLAAGFARLRVAAEGCPRFGIAWPEPFSVPMVAYAG
jgi:SAM-dependent methyltransferase